MNFLSNTDVDELMIILHFHSKETYVMLALWIVIR